VELRSSGEGTRLSVRVGVGLGPGGGDGLRDGSFWDFVEMLEEVGYDSLWLSDSATRGRLAPLPALAAVAARTQRLKLGVNVLVLPSRSGGYFTFAARLPLSLRTSVRTLPRFFTTFFFEWCRVVWIGRFQPTALSARKLAGMAGGVP